MTDPTKPTAADIARARAIVAEADLQDARDLEAYIEACAIEGERVGRESEVFKELYDLGVDIDEWPSEYEAAREMAARLMAERAARADPEAALRILDATSPSVPPDPDDELPPESSDP